SPKSPLQQELEESNTQAESIKMIIQLIHRFTGIDFSQYKFNTIYRRLERRMNLCKVNSLKQYHAYLLDHEDEIHKLQHDLLIGVTQFFRNPEAFERLDTEVLPHIFEKKTEEEEIRIWVSGCSTGEEAYSILLLFEEYKAKHQRQNPLKIFATDIDTQALETASMGRYPINIALDVDKERLQKFFQHEENYYKVISEIRNQIVFAKHNVAEDPPFNKMDMIVCRNLLIYLGPLLQKKVFSFFQFSILRDSFLFLGPSESLGEFRSNWIAVNRKWKIFKYGNHEKPRFLDLFSFQSPDNHAEIEEHKLSKTLIKSPVNPPNFSNIYKEILAEQFSPMSVFFNKRMEALYVFGGMNSLLNLPNQDMRLDLLNMVPEELVLPLSNATQKLLASNKAVVYEDIKIEKPNNETSYYDLKVEKISHKRLKESIFLMTLQASQIESHTSSSEVLKVSIDHMTQERINFLEQQLLDTKESLFLTLEEKENSNEELQASTEELQASNEELMASNEELQSTNEELQSVNEELFTLNSELQSKIDELVELSTDMENFLDSTEIGIIFLDGRLRLRKFTPAAQNHVPLIVEDIGRSFLNFQALLGKEKEDLPALVKEVQAHKDKVEVHFSSAGGLPFLLRIQPYKRMAKQIDGIVIAFIPL
ncbi:MAG: CheR family methyltransferase, partial [Bacteroidota bacterium]